MIPRFPKTGICPPARLKLNRLHPLSLFFRLWRRVSSTYIPVYSQESNTPKKKKNIVLSGNTYDFKDKYFFFTLPKEFSKSEDENYNAFFIAELTDHVLEVFLLFASYKDVKIPDQESRIAVKFQ